MAKYMRGHAKRDPLAAGRIALSTVIEPGKVTSGMYCPGWPIAGTPTEAAQVLKECGTVNVPNDRQFCDQVRELVTAKDSQAAQVR